MGAIMDRRLKNRLITFYVAGVLNALFGLYVIIEGPSFLPADKVGILGLVFLAFTVVNFYTAHYLKKKWLADNAGKQGRNSDPVQGS